MTLKIFTDGGSKGNPGPAAVGMVFYLDNRKIFSYRQDIGVATNNDAEYKAVITAYKKLSVISCQLSGITKIEFYSDSQLLVNQLNGLYKVKNARIREYIIQIRILEQEVGLPVGYHQIPREKNRVADGLVNLCHSRL